MIILCPLFLLLVYSAPLQKVPCKCMNGGTCDPLPFISRCECPQQFIGPTCNLPAKEISSQTISASLSTNYSYFYFQPDSVNYYKMNFKICMKSNPSQSSTILYLQTQRNDGSLRQFPSFFQTSRIVLDEKQCVSFSTHYIGTKRKQNKRFRKIIFGFKVMENNDFNHYLNTYFIGQQFIEPQIIQNSQKIQNIDIKMTYQMYLQPSYLDSVSIAIISFVVMVILVSFILYLKNKYTVNSLDAEILQEMQMYSLYIAHMERVANPEEYTRLKISQLKLEKLMPVTYYSNTQSLFSANVSSSHLLSKTPQNELETCPICLLQFQHEEQIRTTPCHHTYHRQCIDNWFQNQSSCPMCRRRMNIKAKI